MALEADDRQRVEDSGLAEEVRKTGLEPFLETEQGLRLAATPGGCVLLDEDNLCRLHSRCGHDAKPRVCQTFPFVFTPTPAGVRVSVSFCCTAVQQNSGRPLAEHAQALTPLLTATTSSSQVTLSPGRELSWEATDFLHVFLSDALEKGLFRPALHRLWQALAGLAEGSHQRPQFEKALSVASDHISPAALAYLDLVVMSYLATFESNSAEHAQQLSEALQCGGELVLDRWDFKVEAAELYQVVAQHQHRWQPGLTRYLRALLFRRILAHKETALNGLMALTLVEPLFGFYLSVAMLRGSRLEPAEEDYALAYDEIERELMLHCRHSMQSFLSVWGQNFLSRV